MELCHCITRSVGGLCFERSEVGQVYGVDVLGALGESLFGADMERAQGVNVLKDDAMREARRLLEAITNYVPLMRRENTPREPRTQAQLSSLFDALKMDVTAAIPKLKGIRQKLQAHAILYLCAFYLSSHAGADKRKGVLAVVHCFEAVMRDEKIMKNLQQHLRSKVFLTDNQTELCSCFLDLHVEVLVVTAFLIVQSATDTCTANAPVSEALRSTLRQMCDLFITHVQTMENNYEPVALISLNKSRSAVPCIAPVQSRIEVLRAAFAYVRRAANFTSNAMQYCVQ